MIFYTEYKYGILFTAYLTLDVGDIHIISVFNFIIMILNKIYLGSHRFSSWTTGKETRLEWWELSLKRFYWNISKELSFNYVKCKI